MPCCSSARIRSARATTRRRSPTERVRRLGSDLVADVTPLLPGFDALVTDYSSLAFDAALVPLPVVFLAPDLEEYARRRGFYGTLRRRRRRRLGRRLDRTPPRSSTAVLATPRSASAGSQRSRALSARVHAFRDGGNTRRVYRAILAGIEADSRRFERTSMTDARFTTDGGPALILSGEGTRPASVELVGARARVAATLTGRGKTWRAVLPLRAARWGFPELPLPTGSYELRIEAADDGPSSSRRPCRSPSSARCAPSSSGWTLRDRAARSTRRTTPAKVRTRSSVAMRRGPGGSRTRSSSRASTAATRAATRSRSIASSRGARPA